MRRALDAAPPPLFWSEFGEGAIPYERSAEPSVWGDVVLRGRDLAASYHLAVVVDDALQGVSDVVRGRDLLAATSVHRLLQDLLGLPAPRYRHHRLVLDANGAKLSKSRQSLSLARTAQTRRELGRSSRGAGVRRGGKRERRRRAQLILAVAPVGANAGLSAAIAAAEGDCAMS